MHAAMGQSSSESLVDALRKELLVEYPGELKG